MSGVTVDLDDILEKTDGDKQFVDLVEISADELEKAGYDGEGKVETIIGIDISLSMQDEFDDGSVDKALQLGLAYASVLDPDHRAGVFFFGEGVYRAPHVDLLNYKNWLRRNKRHLESYTHLGAGMELAVRMAAEEAKCPRMADVLNYRVATPALSSAPAPRQSRWRMGRWSTPAAAAPQQPGLEPIPGKPVKTLIFTDGLPHDKPKAERTQFVSSWTTKFWSYVYVSNQPGGADYLRTLDNQPGRYADNSNMASFPSFQDLQPDAFAAAAAKDFGPWTQFVRNPQNGLYLAA